jgi:hypothetical protein
MKNGLKHIKEFEIFESESSPKVRVFIKEIPYETKVWDPIGKRKVTDSGKTKILDIAGRKIVLLEINGVNCPFYLSTGGGGKKNVPAGEWYPFFGIGWDGWFNKGTESDIINYYDVPLLKYYSEYLNKEIGDIRDKMTPSAHAPSFSSARDFSEAGKFSTFPHIEAINKDLSPTDNESPYTKNLFYENVKRWKDNLRKAIS